MDCSACDMPLRQPWDVDPSDREHPRKQRVPVAEGLRLFAKGAVIFGAYMLLKSRTDDREGIGAALLLAAGVATAAIALIDLAWLPRQTDADRIFLSDKRQARLALLSALAAGLIMSILGMLRDQ